MFDNALLGPRIEYIGLYSILKNRITGILLGSQELNESESGTKYFVE